VFPYHKCTALFLYLCAGRPEVLPRVPYPPPQGGISFCAKKSAHSHIYICDMSTGGKYEAVGGFSVEVGYLEDAIKRVKHVLPAKSKSGNKLLEYVLLMQKGDKLELQASGLEAQASFDIKVRPIKGEPNEVRIAVPYKQLLSFMKGFQDWQELRCAQIKEENNAPCLLIESIWGQHIFQGVEASEYPKFLELNCDDYTTVDVSILREAVSQVAFAADDSGLYGLDGVYFDFDGNYTHVVATNKYILSLYSREFFFICTPSQNFFVPVKALQAFLLGTEKLLWANCVSIYVSSHHIQLESSGFKVSSVLINGSFPNYRKVIPSETPYIATLEREKLYEAIKRLLLFVDRKLPRVDLTFANNNVTILGRSTVKGTAEMVNLVCQYGGDTFRISFNAKFLLRILENLKSKHIIMKMVGNGRPVAIQPEPQAAKAHVLCLISSMLVEEA
jgi:DNA polymerase III beta subunit